MKMSWRKDVRINSEGGGFTARILTLDQEERLLCDDQRLKRVAKQQARKYAYGKGINIPIWRVERRDNQLTVRADGRQPPHNSKEYREKWQGWINERPRTHFTAVGVPLRNIMTNRRAFSSLWTNPALVIA